VAKAAWIWASRFGELCPCTLVQIRSARMHSGVRNRAADPYPAAQLRRSPCRALLMCALQQSIQGVHGARTLGFQCDPRPERPRRKRWNEALLKRVREGVACEAQAFYFARSDNRCLRCFAVQWTVDKQKERGQRSRNAEALLSCGKWGESAIERDEARRFGGGMRSVKQAAERLGVSANKIYQLVSAREISFYRVGGKILFSDEDIAAYLASCHFEISSHAAITPIPRTRLRLKHLKLRSAG
jgi:excisionase family DNA binding protein